MEILKEGTITIRDGQIWVSNFELRVGPDDDPALESLYRLVVARVRAALAEAEAHGIHCDSSATSPTIVSGRDGTIRSGAPATGDER